MRAAARFLSRRHKQRLKTLLGNARLAWVRRFRSFNANDFRETLLRLGLKSGDTVLMHSAFEPTGGFSGTPNDLIDVVVDVLGPEGNLVMTSMAYASSTKQYLISNPTFDVRRTASRMGIVTEVFRRRKSVLRSWSPTHPVLAQGKRAAFIVAGHDACTFPCGPGSPFDKMLKLDGKMLYFGLPFEAFTFVHTIEHILREELPFELYDEEPISCSFTDGEGCTRSVLVKVFSDRAVKTRDVAVITREMTTSGTAHWARLGNTQIVVAGMQDAVETGRALAKRGIFPFTEPYE